MSYRTTIAALVVLIAVLMCSTRYAMSEENATGLTLLDAVSATLEKQPDILIKKQLAQEKLGTLLQQNARFSPLLNIQLANTQATTPFNSIEQSIYGLPYNTQRTIGNSLGIGTQLRSGITIAPSMNIMQSVDSGTDTITTNRARLNVAATIPVLKGGRNEVTAQEDVATLEVTASNDAVRASMEQNICATVNWYWLYCAAIQRHAIQLNTEARIRQLVEDTRKLAQAGERTVTDVKKLEADLADKTMQRLRGERTLYIVQEQLGLAMGLFAEEIVVLKPPADTFPPVDTAAIAYCTEHADDLIAYALDNLSELAMYQHYEFAAQRLVAAAKGNIKPTLDLQFNVGYRGLQEGKNGSAFYGSLDSQIESLDYVAMTTFAYPIGNKDARGLLKRREAEYQKRLIDRKTAQRQMAVAIRQALRNVAITAATYAEAARAADAYQRAYDDEQKRLRAGLATTLDVILMDDKLQQAQLNAIDAAAEYSVAVAHLRHVTGTLFKNNVTTTITKEQLISLENIMQNAK